MLASANSFPIKYTFKPVKFLLVCKDFHKQSGSKARQDFTSCAWDEFATPAKLPPTFDIPPFIAVDGLLGLKSKVSNHKGTIG